MGIGTILIERELITSQQLAEAIEEQNTTGERLDHVLLRLGYVSNTKMLEAIARQFDMPIVDLSTIEVSADVLKTLPARLVFKQRCVPIDKSNGTLRIATCDPFELTSFDELCLLTGLTIDLVLADEQDLRKFIRAHYGVAGDTLDALADVQPVIEVEGTVASDLDEIEQASEASVIKLVNDLMVEAIRERATDIHIEPYEDTLSIRYRIDGVLTEAGVPPTISRFRNAIISRLKIMASLNIAEKRKPQDGRISLRSGGNEYDLRVSVIPMLFGEGVVLRILNKSTIMFDLKDLGMDREMLVKWDEMINMPHGISLVTGPTGCGKSTTLYASLQRIVSVEVKAITIEDPVEYHVSGVNQIPVHEKVGLTFATGLRSILRHDPDIIMIGEIRDLETAQAAVQASLTGHLVFSTLHTNDATGAMTRLIDMGVEPFLVASSVEGVLAQRLVRRICSECKEVHTPATSEFPPDFGSIDGQTFYHGVGCRECRHTGFRGRLGLFELLTMNERIKELVMQRASTNLITNAAVESGDVMLLRDAAYIKVRSGDTTLAEALRATKG